MHRTTIMLPEELRNRAMKKAAEMGVSLGELIRDSLDRLLRPSEHSAGDDPLFSDDAVFTGESPEDLAAEHDRHLYG